MRLEKIHVDSFGVLQDLDLELKDGLNVILKENGWGKSTLAAFIRVMFYGFENERKRSELENERRRYTPWQTGNSYGGYLEMEAGGKRYRLERSFGKKEDSFRLYDLETKLECDDHSDNIGEELFGIDRESFSRTVFVGQQDCPTSVTSQISAKIGNVNEDSADMGSFMPAIEALHSEQNRLTGRRSTGEIAKLKTVISALKAETVGKASVEEAYDRLGREMKETEGRLSETGEKIKALNEKRDRLSSYNAILAKKKEYEGLKAELKKAAEEYEQARGYFGERLPEYDSVEDMLLKASEIKRLRADMAESSPDTEEAAAKAELSGIFKDGVPAEEELKRLKAELFRIEELKKKIAELERYENERLRETEAEESFIERLRLRREAEEERLRREKEERERKALAERRQKLKSSAMLMGTAVILFLAALCVCIFAHTMIMGAAIVAAGLIIFVMGVRIRPGRDVHEENMYEPFTDIDAELERYRSGRKCREDRSAEKREAEREAEETGDRVFSYLIRYTAADRENMSEAYYTLLGMIEKHARCEKSAKAEAVKRERAEALEAELSRFMREYSKDGRTDPEELKLMRDRLMFLKEKKKALDERTEAVGKYEEEEDVSAFEGMGEAEGDADAETLSGELRLLSEVEDTDKKILERYRGEAARIAERLEDMGLKEAELSEKEAELKQRQREFDIVTKTEEYLTKAKDNFLKKYMEPMQKAFDKYYTLLSGDESDAYDLDVNLNVMKREMGGLRDIGLLSEGNKDLVGLCRRMAMVEAMYENEKPFLVFDDPFVNLDDERTECATGFLKELAGEYQILYITCNSGRAPA